MKKTTLICTLVSLLTMSAWAGQDSSFQAVMKHYEPIRQALIADSMEGLTEHGRAIAAELESLEADFNHDRVGATHEVMLVVHEKLPQMIAAAEALAGAESLENARDAFYELSRTLVRWVEGVPDEERPSVAYCSMYKRSWLQPGTEIGNPYGNMPRCGTIVSS